jgi:hypothetical protein
MLSTILQSSSTQLAMFRHTFPAFDAAGPGRRVYQVRSSSDHKLDAQGILKLLISAQLLTHDGTRTLNCSSEKLEFYWIVHPAHFAHWSKMPPEAYPDNANEAAMDCWNKYVEQYVLQALND